MTPTDEHPLVLAYLRRFDVVATRLPEPRRARLRAEIADHLREATSPESADADVRRAIAEIGDPAAIVGEEATQAETTERAIRPAWVVGGAFVILSLVIGYTLQWSAPLPGDLPLPSIVWAAGLLVLSLARPSVTAHRPLGTGALVALAVWSVGSDVALGIIGRGLSVSDPGVAGLAFGYVDAFVSFLLALVAAIQIARVEVVPRPWRWAPAWVLAAIVASWLLDQLVGVTLGANAVGAVGVLVALDGVTTVGGTVILGIITIALGFGVLRRPVRD